MSEPIDTMEELAGDVRDLRVSVENAGSISIEYRCANVRWAVNRADLTDDIDDGIFCLTTTIQEMSSRTVTPATRAVLGCFVSAIENLLELEKSLQCDANV